MENNSSKDFIKRQFKIYWLLAVIKLKTYIFRKKSIGWWLIVTLIACVFVYWKNGDCLTSEEMRLKAVYIVANSEYAKKYPSVKFYSYDPDPYYPEIWKDSAIVVKLSLMYDRFFGGKQMYIVSVYLDPPQIHQTCFVQDHNGEMVCQENMRLEAYKENNIRKIREVQNRLQYINLFFDRCGNRIGNMWERLEDHNFFF